MKKKSFIKSMCVSFSLATVLFMVGCSDEKTSTDKTPATNSEKVPVSHTLLNSTVTSSDKQKFEHTFENQCVQRELKNSANPENDKVRVGKACECIATFMMKDLTAIEAEKLLVRLAVEFTREDFDDVLNVLNRILVLKRSALGDRDDRDPVATQAGVR